MLALTNEERMVHDYPFERLDDLVFRRLDPLQPHWTAPEEPGKLEALISDELWAVFHSLKQRIFNLLVASEIQAVLAHYLDAGEALSTQAKRNLANYPDDSALMETGEYLVWALTDFEHLVESRFEKYLGEKSRKKRKPVSPEDALFKLLCKMSVDQIGIFLKACDDNKVVAAKSLSIVFQSIVPFLSTDRMLHISWRSMRKSTYQFSQADLEFVIAVLEKLIARIREYF